MKGYMLFLGLLINCRMVLHLQKLLSFSFILFLCYRFLFSRHTLHLIYFTIMHCIIWFFVWFSMILIMILMFFKCTVIFIFCNVCSRMHKSYIMFATNLACTVWIEIPRWSQWVYKERQSYRSVEQNELLILNWFSINKGSIVSLELTSADE